MELYSNIEVILFIASATVNARREISLYQLPVSEQATAEQGTAHIFHPAATDTENEKK